MKRDSVYQISLRAFTPEGTLCSAIKMLPFLAEIGPKYLQLMPIVSADEGEDRLFWSSRQIASKTDNPKNSYRIKDYFSIDEEYGTEDDLRDFVYEAHKLGMKVLLDLVYLHCGPNAVFLKEHPDYVKRNEDGTIYIGEWNFPLLNFDSAELREYLWSNMIYFVQEFDIDGYRCDVGDRVPLDFWDEGVKRIRAIKSEIFMVNEGRNPEYLTVFDANYFYDGCFDAVTVAQGKMRADIFCHKWEACRKMLPDGGRMLHFIDNHDVASDCYEARHEKTIGSEGVEALLVLNFLLDGIPFIFNGNEVADELKHNMFSNRFYGKDAAINWANALCDKGKTRIELMKKLFQLREEHDALDSGSLNWCKHTAPEQVAVFLREDDRQIIFAAVNMTGDPAVLEVEMTFRKLHLLKPLMMKNAWFSMEKDKLYIQILGYGYLIGKM